MMWRVLPCAILLVPSLSLLATLPPLWRDSDGFNQVMQRPGAMTIVNFPPLYCFLARVPLYVGDLWECAFSGASLPFLTFFREPVLTDTGLFLLVVAQHALLLFSQTFLVRGLRLPAISEVLVALLFAANASFYTFAHCIGSEAISVAATLWLAGIALRIIRSRSPKPRDWCWLGVSLAACLLTRHINAVLVVVVPAALIFAAGVRAIRDCFRFRRLAVCSLRNAAVATLVGVASLIVVKGSVRLLRDEFHVKVRSTLGFTFLWRLKFLSQMDSDPRSAFLRDLPSKANDALSEKLLAEISANLTSDGQVDPVLIHARFYQAIRKVSPKHAATRLYASENELARQVLLALPMPYRSAVARDFVTSLTETPASLARAPFETTLYCFERFPELPGLAATATFRRADSRARLIIARDGAYERLMNFSYASAVALWAALAIVGFLFGRRGSDRILSFSAALVCSGLAMMFLNCALTEFLPRYTLPLWTLLFVAIVVQLPPSLNALARRTRFARA